MNKSQKIIEDSQILSFNEELTKSDFLSALKKEYVATYPWAKDKEKLDKFMVSVKNTIDGVNTSWNKDGPAMKAAWKKIGGKGNPTYKQLKALK